MNGSQKERLGKFFLSEETYAEFCAFFQKVKTSSYSYKAVMARRCFNLFAAILGADKEGGLPGGVISNQGLLLYTKDMADFYIKRKRFPSILLVDDILLYGRALSNSIYVLEEKLYEYIREEMNGEAPSRFGVHLALMRAVDVWVFARNKGAYTVEKSFLSDVSSEKTIGEKELNQLSRQISLFLMESGLANTSFLLSITDGGTFDSSFSHRQNRWEYLSWNYQGFEGDFWFSNGSYICGVEGERAVYRYLAYQGLPDFTNIFTGMVFPRSLSRVRCEYLLWTIMKMVSPETGEFFRRLRCILEEESNRKFREYEMQLLCLMMSAATLWDFLGGERMTYSWNSVLEESDLWKIACNFGKFTDVYIELKSMLANIRLLKLFSTRKGTAVQNSKIYYTRSEEKKVNFNRRIEDRICELGQESDIEAYEYSYNRKSYNPLKRERSVIRLEEYIRDNAQQRATARESVAVAASMMRAGVLSMRFGNGRVETEVSSFLKAGELSTHTLPERYQDLMPSLIFVEDRSWMMNLPPKEALEGFVQYLQDHAKEIPDDDQWLVGDLSRQLPGFLQRNYAAGKTLRRWQLFNWKYRDYIVKDAEEFASFSEEGRMKKKKYKEMAVRYIYGRTH